jgi:flavin-dependent dehydrogenase
MRDNVKIDIKRITADVAIIGGGTAGLNAAMAAAERGFKVLVADKACIERSGACRQDWPTGALEITFPLSMLGI